jgi:crossover junction endodeoxyribonuclease RuvC
LRDEKREKEKGGRILMEGRVIMGIDPGTEVLGWGVILARGAGIEVLGVGVLRLKKYGGHYERLGAIYAGVGGLIERYGVEEMALESPFLGKNVQSMLKLGRAQGVSMAAGVVRGVSIYEYAPQKIKLAITGNGGATKEQVSWMLGRLLGIALKEAELDATDGLAAAICHRHSQSPAVAGDLARGAPGGGWKEYVERNPEKVVKGVGGEERRK